MNRHPANIARHDRRDFGQRAADSVASAIGSWRFIIVQTTVIIAWIVLNVTAAVHHWDPYPFILLNLAFSTQAAYAAPLLQLSQNRQSEHDRQRAEADFATNETALAEIRADKALTGQVHALTTELAGLVREMHERTITVTASAQGIDISSNQPVYTAAELGQYVFAGFRATLGTTDTDPNFPRNWANGKTAGIHRLAYHELTNLSAETTQAAHFIDVVTAQGVEAGDMLACVASDYPVASAAVKSFCDTVQAAFPHCPVLVYSDQSELGNWTAEAAEYPLWLAFYSDTAPESVAPWKTWTLWQWSGTGLDRDAYNGTAEQLQAWLGTFVPGPSKPAPKPAPAPAAKWAAGITLQYGSKGSDVLALQEALNDADEYGARDLAEDGNFGEDTQTAVRNFEADEGLAVDEGIAGPQVRNKLIALGHLTSAGVPVA